MKVKSVSYSITFELPPEFGIERWRKIGLEIEPEKSEVVEQVLDGVDKQIKTWHEAKFPELYGKAKPKKHDINNVDEIKPVTVNDIYSCKDLKVLDSYKLIVRSKPELQKAYDIHFKKLCNKS